MIQAMVIEGDTARYRRIIEEIGLLRPGHTGVRRSRSTSTSATSTSSSCTTRWSRSRRSGRPTRCRASSTRPGPYGPVIKAANLPASFVIIQRINLGLMAILGDLHATANFRRIADELWPWVDGPPVDPDGRGRGRLAGVPLAAPESADVPPRRALGVRTRPPRTMRPCPGADPHRPARRRRPRPGRRRRAGRGPGGSTRGRRRPRPPGGALLDHAARRGRRGRRVDARPSRCAWPRAPSVAAALPPAGAGRRRRRDDRRPRRRARRRRRRQARHARPPAGARRSRPPLGYLEATGDTMVADHLADRGRARRACRPTSPPASSCWPAPGRRSTRGGGHGSRSRCGPCWPAGPSC